MFLFRFLLFCPCLPRPFTALIAEIIFAKSLISLRYTVPTSAIILDAPLLHEQIDQFLLLLTDTSEVVQEVPAVHIKSILDIIKQCFFPMGEI